MGRVESRSFRERSVVLAGGIHGAQAADKLHAHALLYILALAQQDGPDLSSRTHMSAAAGGQVEIGYLDQPQIPGLLGRQLAQSHQASLLKRNKANRNRTIFSNNLIRQSLRLYNLRRRKGLCAQIDGATLGAHVEAHGWNIEQANKGRRKHMLARVLLYMVAAARRIGQAANGLSRS